MRPIVGIDERGSRDRQGATKKVLKLVKMSFHALRFSTSVKRIVSSNLRQFGSSGGGRSFADTGKWGHVCEAPQEITRVLREIFQEDKHKHKVLLAMGVYRDSNGMPYVPQAVMKVCTVDRVPLLSKSLPGDWGRSFVKP